MEEVEEATSKVQAEFDSAKAALASQNETYGARIAKLEEKLGIKTAEFGRM